MTDPTRQHDPFKPFLDVAAALLSSPLLDEALQNVAQAIGEAMNVTSVDIQSYHAEQNCLVEEAVWNHEGLSDADHAYLGTRIDLAERPTFMPILERGEMLEIHIDDPDLPPEERAAFEQWGYKTTLDAPLIIGDRVTGVLGVTETRFVRRFLSMERERFEKLCGMAAAAMNNARLMARQEVHSSRLALLLEMSRRLAAGGGDAGEACAAAARGCLDVLGAATAGVFELQVGEGVATPGRALAAVTGDEPGADASDDGPSAVGSTPVDPATLAAALADRALRVGSAVTAATPGERPEDPGDDPADATTAALRSAGVRTAVAATAIREGMSPVVLCAGWRDERSLTDGELKLVEALAAQVALALDNDRLADVCT